MSDEKYSVEQVADIVNSEGLGYAVQHGLSADSIEDLRLAGLWATAKTALKAIGKILEAATATDDAHPMDGA